MEFRRLKVHHLMPRQLVNLHSNAMMLNFEKIALRLLNVSPASKKQLVEILVSEMLPHTPCRTQIISFLNF